MFTRPKRVNICIDLTNYLRYCVNYQKKLPEFSFGIFNATADTYSNAYIHRERFLYVTFKYTHNRIILFYLCHSKSKLSNYFTNRSEFALIFFFSTQLMISEKLGSHGAKGNLIYICRQNVANENIFGSKLDCTCFDIT